MIWMLTENSCEDWEIEQTMKLADTARLRNSSKSNTLMQNTKMQLMEDEAKIPCFVVWAVFVVEMCHTRKQHEKCFSPSLHHMVKNILSV